jgi:hypothetical protein
MKKISHSSVLIIIFIMVGILGLQAQNQNARVVLKDLSDIRGFNYTPANVASPLHHIDTWVKYDKAIIEHDLDLARQLNLNQVRVLVPYQVYAKDKAGLPEKLRPFVRECYKQGIGVKPVVGSGGWIRDTISLAKVFAANLLESGELIAMYELPTREVKMRRQGKPNITALRTTLLKYIRILEPYMKPTVQN